MVFSEGLPISREQSPQIPWGRVLIVLSAPSFPSPDDLKLVPFDALVRKEMYSYGVGMIQILPGS